MPCCICLDDFSSPVSLPCGHIFCHDCLKRAVQAIQPYSTLHACPTCRAHYYLSPLDLSTVPHHLRPHLTSSIRRVYLDLPHKTETERPDTPTPEHSCNLATEAARLQAENDALRHNCFMWRKRAEVQSAATLGLLEMSRTAKDQVTQAIQQRDKIQKNYLRLDHDFRRQQVILRAMMTALPPQRLGSNPHVSHPLPAVIGQPACLSVLPQRPCPPTDGRSRKRLRADSDDSALPRSPPAKLARTAHDDDSITDDRHTAVRAGTEIS